MDNETIVINSNKKSVGETTLKAVVAGIPVLGGPLSSLLSDYFGGRKEKRFVEFLEGIKNDLEDNIDLINEGFVLKEDFYDIFEITTRKIILTRHEEKRDAYRKILTNSMISEEINYDEMEDYIVLLDMLRPEHILLLEILKDPIEYDMENGRLVGNGGGFSITISQIMRKLLPEWKEQDIIEVISKLESERLVKGIIDGYKVMMTDQGIHHLTNTLTKKGTKFCKYILE